MPSEMAYDDLLAREVRLYNLMYRARNRASRGMYQRLRDERNRLRNRACHWETCSEVEAMVGNIAICEDCGLGYHMAHQHFDGESCGECGLRHGICVDVTECNECGFWSCSEHTCDEPDDADTDIDYRTVATNRSRGVSHPLAAGPRLVGVELEAENGTGLDLSYPYGITHDGSLERGIEIQTPPASGDELVSILTVATTNLIDNGWDVDSGRPGTHVHLDLTDKVHDLTFQAHLFSSFYALEDVLYGLQNDPDARLRGGYCYPLHGKWSLMEGWGRKGARELPYKYHGLRADEHRALDQARSDKYHSSRYHGINFHAIPYHGTIEIRIHEGTLDLNRLLPWIDLLQCVIDTTDKRWPGYKSLIGLNAINARAWWPDQVDQGVADRKINAIRRIFAPPDHVMDYLTDRLHALPSV